MFQCFFRLYCVFNVVINIRNVIGKRKPLERFIVEEGAKPAIFGAYSYDPIKQTFEVDPESNNTAHQTMIDGMGTPVAPAVDPFFSTTHEPHEPHDPHDPHEPHEPHDHPTSHSDFIPQGEGETSQRYFIFRKHVTAPKKRKVVLRSNDVKEPLQPSAGFPAVSVPSIAENNVK